MSSTALTAAAMGAATLGDPQFRLPRLPRLAPGLVIVHTAEGVLVEGGPTRQLLSGAAAADVFERLVPLLDGTRTVPDLASELEIGELAAHSSVSLLYATGLLEDAADEPKITTDRSPQHQFFARSIDSTQVNTSGAEAVQRLQDATIAVAIADEEQSLGGQIIEELRRGGIGNVVTDADNATSILVTVGDSETVRGVGEAAGQQGVPVFPIVRRGRAVYYGPIIDPSYTVTITDLLSQVAAEDDAPSHPEDDMLIATMAAGDVLSLQSRVGAPLTKQTMQRFDIDSFTVQPLTPVRQTEDGIPTAFAFEASTAFPPRHLNSPRDHQVHYKPANIALQHESKLWPSAPTRPLPVAVQPQLPNSRPTLAHLDETEPVTLEALADIIIRTAGNRDNNTPKHEKMRRWAPSGGNLGSVQAYVIARSVIGLEPGVYGYQRGDNTLAELTWADPEMPVAGVDEDADAVLIFTGALPRVAHKYAAFSWRIIHLDAGVALTQARLLAAGQRLRATPSPAWDDEALIDMLALDANSEPITAVLALTSRNAEGA